MNILKICNQALKEEIEKEYKGDFENQETEDHFYQMIQELVEEGFFEDEESLIKLTYEEVEIIHRNLTKRLPNK